MTDSVLTDWAGVPPAVALDCVPGAWLAAGLRPLRPAGAQPHLCARAVTARVVPPDFGAVVRALDLCGPGQVLVIAAGGDPSTAMIGEILSGHLRARGAAGVICDGMVRDVGTLAGWDDFSVFARGVVPRGPTSATGGEVGQAVAFAGGVVHPGDLLLGDDDGVVVVPTSALAAGLEPARAKLALEARWIAALAETGDARAVFGIDPDAI